VSASHHESRLANRLDHAMRAICNDGGLTFRTHAFRRRWVSHHCGTLCDPIGRVIGDAQVLAALQ